MGAVNTQNLFNKVHGLDGLTIIDCEMLLGDCCVLTAIPNEDTIKCPICKSTHLSKNGTYDRYLSDIPINGMPTTIHVKGHKYNCLNPKCGKRNVVPQYPKSVDENAQITLRLKTAVADTDFSSVTFESVANQYGISTTTVQRIFKEKLNSINAKLFYPAPVILGLDEVHIQNAMRLVMVDLESPTVSLIEIAKNRSKRTVIQCLSRFDHPERIKYVMTDMYKGYIESVKEVLPDAKVVVDKFHVLRYLLIATESSRKLACEYIEKRIDALPEEQKKEALLKWQSHNTGDGKMSHYWFKKNKDNYSDRQKRGLMSLIKDFPEFGEIIRIKELFLDIYRCTSRADAEQKLNDWEKSPGINDKTSFVYPFSQVVRTVENYREYIMNYFDVPDGYRKTNGGTEGINSEIKRINFNGKGYSFEVLRGKLLFGDTKVKILSKAEKKAANGSFNATLKKYAGFETQYDFDMLSDFNSIFNEACCNDTNLFSNCSDIIIDAYMGNTMRLSEYLMGDSDFAIAMKDAANKLDNNGSYSNAYLKVPVPLPELKNRLDIICAHIQGSFEHSDLEDYLKGPTPDEFD